jgi:hypothetical protein
MRQVSIEAREARSQEPGARIARAVFLLASGFWLLAPSPGAAPDTIRFDYIDIYIDSGGEPLAAHQFEATARAAGATIVGVEGGEHPAFADAPYYDPRALMNDRIIVAAFSTASDLPAGRTRVARLHLRLTGDATAEHDLVLHAAASSEGNRIPATISMGQGETP